MLGAIVGVGSGDADAGLAGIGGCRRRVLLEDSIDLHIAVRHEELIVLDGHAAADDLPLLEVVAFLGMAVRVISVPATANKGDAKAIPLPSVFTVTVCLVGAKGESSSKIALIATLLSGMVNLLLVITSPAGDTTCHSLKR